MNVDVDLKKICYGISNAKMEVYATYEGDPNMSSLFRLEEKVVGWVKESFTKRHTMLVLREENEFVRQNGYKGRVDPSQRYKIRLS